MFIINSCLKMFRASLCPSSGEQRPCYCIWYTALVLLDVVGSGCGALRFRMRACERVSTKTKLYENKATIIKADKGNTIVIWYTEEQSSKTREFIHNTISQTYTTTRPTGSKNKYRK